VIELPKDFRDLLIELTDADAEFVIVGGFAVGAHGHPRATKDLDILVRPTESNAKKIYKALAAFGAPLNSLSVSESDFAGYDGVLQIGLPPRRIDIINHAAGITFDEAVSDVVMFDLEGRAVRIIGLDALLRNKLAAARPQDLADVDALKRAKRDKR
jgi:hypothetical protein